MLCVKQAVKLSNDTQNNLFELFDFIFLAFSSLLFVGISFLIVGFKKFYIFLGNHIFFDSHFSSWHDFELFCCCLISFYMNVRAAENFSTLCDDTKCTFFLLHFVKFECEFTVLCFSSRSVIVCSFLKLYEVN